MDAQKNIRAFLAIEPPGDILQAVSGLQEKLKQEITGKISWTRPQGNHITLKFFGNIDKDDIKNICAVVEKQIALVPPLSLIIEKMGVFPDARRPRVLWLGSTGDVAKLTTLQLGMESDFEGIGFERGNRPFRAHLTLGRIKIPREITGISEALNKYGDFTVGEFSCKELILFQSKLMPQGAVYTELRKFNFSG
ncbi:MAG: 2'-5' RNA ligase [Deltaproteobacteria bacterium RBG_19FT_COMBO_43_11]|nr:MAG: 2'-5' RNA ligase [Deltaproteobacteria bacterium RBG_19FT_COMBO_43_11]